jgi:hypothetical protein
MADEIVEHRLKCDGGGVVFDLPEKAWVSRVKRAACSSAIGA